MSKRIILNADDFGPCESLNQGIYKAIDAGLISSVSVFVTYGQENIQNIINLRDYIKSKKLNIGIGLHFTITAGQPVSKTRNNTLSDKNTGNFVDVDDFKWRINLKEFENEMTSQISLLAEILGSKENIDHINSHVGICYMKKEFWKILVKQKLPVRSPDKFSTYLGKYRTGRNPIVRTVFERILDKSTLNDNFLQKVRYILINNRAKVRYRRYRYAVKNKIQIPNLTLYAYYKQANENILKNVVYQLAAISSKNKVVEIMLHLSVDDKPDDYRSYNGIDPKSFEGRTRELEVLLESDLLSYMKQHSIDLINYRQI